MRILLVDDDPEIVRFVSRVLEGDGHVVTSATRGSDALLGALSGEFELLICDLMLPDLPGTEVIRAIKAQSPALPVMVISARDRNEELESCLAAGATGYLQKPLHVKDLRAEVRLVEQSRSELRVLVIDSDTVYTTRLANELGSQGCQVFTVTTAREALDSIVAQPPHLLLVDAALPGVAKVIDGARAINIPIFACGVPNKKVGDVLMRAGAAMLLDKPINPDSFMLQARFLVS